MTANEARAIVRAVYFHAVTRYNMKAGIIDVLPEWGAIRERKLGCSNEEGAAWINAADNLLKRGKNEIGK